MKTNVSTILLLVAALISLSASAPEDSLKARAGQFFHSVRKGDTDKAFEVLFEGSPFAQAKSEALESMKEDFRKHLGKSEVIGTELIKEQAYGKSIVKLVYVLKLQSQPLVWEFHFYRAKSSWTLARVGFDEDLRKLD